jgi:hypothetical protein
MPLPVKEKVAMFCQVEKDHVKFLINYYFNMMSFFILGYLYA